MGINLKMVVHLDWAYPIKMSAKKHVKTWELLFRMETGKTMANRALPSRKKLVNRAIASEIRLTGFANKRFEFKPQNVELRDLWTFFGHGMMTKGNKKNGQRQMPSDVSADGHQKNQIIIQLGRNIG